MPFASFYLSKKDETTGEEKKLMLDMLIDYPQSVERRIVLEGYHLDKIVPDQNKCIKTTGPGCTRNGDRIMSPWQVRPRGGEWEDINDGEAYKEFNQDSAKCGGYNPTRAMRDKSLLVCPCRQQGNQVGTMKSVSDEIIRTRMSDLRGLPPSCTSIFEALTSDMTTSQISEATGLASRTVRYALNRLLERRAIVAIINIRDMRGLKYRRV